MILVCKGTCAPVAPSFKGQGGSAPVMHLRSGVPVANKTVEACAEWLIMATTPHTVLRSIQRKVTHTNHNVSSAWPKNFTFPLHCEVEERERPHAHLSTSHTKKWSYWSVESAPTRAYEIPRGHRMWLGLPKPTIVGLLKGLGN